MPYTNEQARQALHEQQFKEIMARAELYIHNACVKGVKTYDLPYRLLWDYEHAEHEHMEIPLNEWYPFPKIPKEAEGQQDTEAYRPWDLNTEAGRQAWKFYFVPFLLPYYTELDSWGMFDFFGNTEHAPEEVEQKRRYYKLLLEDYLEHAEAYDTGKHYKKPEDYKRYDLSEWVYLFGYIDRESEEEQEIIQEYTQKLLEESMAFLGRGDNGQY